MKANLYHGKIPSPPSLVDAAKRYRQLEHELGRIEQQLFDPGRILRFPNEWAYDQWRVKAKRAFMLLREEARQLAAWIELNKTESLRVSWSVVKQPGGM